MVKNKILTKVCISGDFHDPMTFFIGLQNFHRILCSTNILQCKIQNVSNAWGPKYVLKFTLNVQTCRTHWSIIGDNLNNIFRSNLLNNLFFYQVGDVVF